MERINANKRKSILVLLPYYFPGYKAGGPIRTIANMVEALGEDACFMVVTRDRDLGDRDKYAGIRTNQWQKVNKADVYYSSPKNVTFPFLARLIRSTPHDILYLNSFFSPAFTIAPLVLRRLGILPCIETIVAPRGEFSPGALKLKSFKKRVYMKVASALKLYDGVVWHASNQMEKAQIEQTIGHGLAGHLVPLAQNKQLVIKMAMNMFVAAIPAQPVPPDDDRQILAKQQGILKLLFLSRISPKKNLDTALNLLARVHGDIAFDIFGPIEDERYWKQCQELIKKLPPRIKVTYRGVLRPSEVSGAFSMYHLFLFPTQGENFGHVIIEALSAGCPVLISDQTPWRNLENQNIGWDIPLTRLELFIEKLQRCVDMDEKQFKEMQECIFRYCRERTQQDNSLEENRRLFGLCRRGKIGRSVM